MRAIAVRKLNDPPEMMDLPKPKPGPGEILVHLSAAGVNPFDWKLAEGKSEANSPHVFPFILGVDGAGVIEEVGEGTGRLAVGDGVFGQFSHPPFGIGTYAEYVVAPESLGISKIPRGIYTVQAAAVPTSGMMAQHALDELGLTKGKTLLLTGAAGGVGSFATQLAANMGIHVIAASRGANQTYLHKFGATEFLNSGSASFLDDLRFAHSGGVDALLDLANRGPSLERLLPFVREGGTVASTIGAAEPSLLSGRNLKGLNVDLHPNSPLLDRVAAEIASGKLRIPLESQMPLAEAANALEASHEGKTRGKTVLVI